MVDRDALVTRVRKLTGFESTLTHPDADIAERLDEAYRELSAFKPWRADRVEDSVVTVAGQADYALPNFDPVIQEPQDLWLEDGTDRYRLPYTSAQTFETFDAGDQSRPLTYTINEPDSGQVTLSLWPTPDAVYTVKMVRQSSAGVGFVNGTSAPWWASELHPILAYVVAVRLLTEEGDQSPRVGAYNAEVSALLQQMMDRYLLAKGTGLIRMSRPTNGVRSFGRVRR